MTKRTGLLRFIRYSLGSVLATIASAAVFPIAYHSLSLGPRTSSFAAFGAGALVNFVGNRFWAWNRRERAGLGRDMAAYAVVAVATALAAAGVTSLADGYARDAAMTGLHRTLFVEGAYFATYGAMFYLKYVVLDKLVFRPRPAPEPPVDDLD